MGDSESRKKEEQEFHDALRGDSVSQSTAANNKFYSITRTSTDYVKAWLADHCKSGTTLDYGCGEGQMSLQMARAGARVLSIDISPVSLQNATKLAEKAGLTDKVSFMAMDAESLGFADDTFDVIHVSGVLHHLDVQQAFPELSRVLKPGGHVIASEALGHNPFIQWYRKLTPHLRTAWEAQHIIKREHLRLAGEHFGRADYRFFHLATLAGVPLRGVPRLGQKVLTALEGIDRLLLRIPGLKWQAWIIVLELSQPVKTAEDPQDSIHAV